MPGKVKPRPRLPSAAEYAEMAAAAAGATSSGTTSDTSASLIVDAGRGGGDASAAESSSSTPAAAAGLTTPTSPGIDVPVLLDSDDEGDESRDCVVEMRGAGGGGDDDWTAPRRGSRPTRSVTLERNQNYERVVDEFSRYQPVMRSHSDRPRPSRPLTRRESVKMVLRNGSVRAARVASMMVVPSNRGSVRDVELEHWINNYRCIPPPIFMIIISLVELAVFIFYVVDQNKVGIQTSIASGVPAHSPLIYQPTRRYEAWRYISYMLIHNGYVHIISNLIFQLLIGLPLEMVHDFWRVGPLYVIGVISGSLATSVVDPWVILCGASGGCYALLGAQFATITMNWKEMKAGWLDSPLRFLLSGPFQLGFWSVLAIINTSFSIYSRFFDARTAFAAHIAGLISGYLVGLCVLKNFSHRPWKWTLRVIAIVTLAVILVFAVVFNAAYTAYYPKQDWRKCCPGDEPH